jgi:hypothetical protein
MGFNFGRNSLITEIDSRALQQATNWMIYVYSQDLVIGKKQKFIIPSTKYSGSFQEMSSRFHTVCMSSFF